MSGFVGLWQRDGRPVETAQLEALTESLRFRGPDGLATWRRGAVGLGHARFVTHAKHNSEPQPLGLDDRYWIAGDIRLDAREELIDALCQSERSAESRHAGDAALVLRAYRAWGEDCMARIHGDFSFAIWDEAAQRLFCARDPFGVRPFFYARVGDLIVVSNTLGCVRGHPRVSSRLDELALADYLCCGRQLEPDLTSFADIRRLPSGRTLLATAGALRTQQYWALPIEPYARHSRPQQYVEHFNDVFTRAVADRAGDGPVSLFLSGGLDSGAIAAALARRLGHVGAHGATRCYTVGWNCAFDDPEPDHARLTAAALELPLDVHEESDCRPFKHLDLPADPGPEADSNYYRQSFVRTLGHMAGHARVALNGQGGDEVLYREVLVDEALRNPGWRLAADAIRTWRAAGRRPPLGLRGWRVTASPDAVVEPWIDGAWARRLGLHERYRATQRPLRRPGAPHAAARRRLQAPFWTPYVERYDAGFSGQLIETCWPFLDHRVIRFALALPPFPWCVDKYLLRRALKPVLPPGIVLRPKTPLRGEPFTAHLARDPHWRDRAQPHLRALGGFIDSEIWRRSPVGTGLAWSLGRPVSLAGWMASSRQALRAA